MFLYENNKFVQVLNNKYIDEIFLNKKSMISLDIP